MPKLDVFQLNLVIETFEFLRTEVFFVIISVLVPFLLI